MNYFICLVVSVLMWCALLGDPYILFLTKIQFWLYLIALFFMLKVGVHLLDNNFSSLHYIGTAMLFIVAVDILSIIFIPWFRDATLRTIGMQDYIQVIHDRHISYWTILIGNLIQYPIFKIIAEADSKEKS